MDRTIGLLQKKEDIIQMGSNSTLKNVLIIMKTFEVELYYLPFLLHSYDFPTPKKFLESYIFNYIYRAFMAMIV
jgi:hypothetical protein